MKVKAGYCDCCVSSCWFQQHEIKGVCLPATYPILPPLAENCDELNPSYPQHASPSTGLASLGIRAITHAQYTLVTFQWNPPATYEVVVGPSNNGATIMRNAG